MDEVFEKRKIEKRYEDEDGKRKAKIGFSFFKERKLTLLEKAIFFDWFSFFDVFFHCSSGPL
jgi:hypothetical protein